MNYQLTEACRDGHLVLVAILLKLGADPAFCDNSSIRAASYHGHTEIVRLLLADSRVDPTAWGNWSIRYASRRGYMEIEKLLEADHRVREKIYWMEKILGSNWNWRTYDK